MEFTGKQERKIKLLRAPSRRPSLPERVAFGIGWFAQISRTPQPTKKSRDGLDWAMNERSEQRRILVAFTVDGILEGRNGLRGEREDESESGVGGGLLDDIKQSTVSTFIHPPVHA